MFLCALVGGGSNSANAREIVWALAIGIVILQGVEGGVILCASISLLPFEEILLDIISNNGFSAGIEAAIMAMLTSVAVSRISASANPVVSS